MNLQREKGCPFGKIEIKLMVKDVLDKGKIMEKRFENNIPGDDWVNTFARLQELEILVHFFSYT